MLAGYIRVYGAFYDRGIFINRNAYNRQCCYCDGIARLSAIFYIRVAASGYGVLFCDNTRLFIISGYVQNINPITASTGQT